MSRSCWSSQACRSLGRGTVLPRVAGGGAAGGVGQSRDGGVHGRGRRLLSRSERLEDARRLEGVEPHGIGMTVFGSRLAHFPRVPFAAIMPKSYHMSRGMMTIYSSRAGPRKGALLERDL